MQNHTIRRLPKFSFAVPTCSTPCKIRSIETIASVGLRTEEATLEVCKVALSEETLVKVHTAMSPLVVYKLIQNQPVSQTSNHINSIQMEIIHRP